MSASSVTDEVFNQSAGGGAMISTEKTFRYAHIFKNVGVPYVIFLLIVGLLSYLARDVVILTVLALTIALGVLLLALYRTFSLQVSDRGITQKTLLGTRSLTWADIRQISAQGSSLRLRGEQVNILISPRLHGAMEIAQQIQAKRPGLFRVKHVSQLVQNSSRTLPMLVVGSLLVVLTLLLYIFRGYPSLLTGLLGLFLSGQALIGWYLSPRSLKIDGNCLTVQYRNRSVSYSADDITGIQAWMTKQGQFRSVVVAFRDQKVLDTSVFRQTPYITYPALKQWHEENVTQQALI